MTITDKNMEQFNTLLIDFYNTGKSEKLKEFLYNTSIQGIFRVFFYCRHANGVIKWFLVSKMVGPFYTVSPQACEDRRKQRQNLTTGGKQK